MFVEDTYYSDGPEIDAAALSFLGAGVQPHHGVDLVGPGGEDQDGHGHEEDRAPPEVLEQEAAHDGAERGARGFTGRNIDGDQSAKEAGQRPNGGAEDNHRQNIGVVAVR